jgi:hypothetical protein
MLKRDTLCTLEDVALASMMLRIECWGCGRKVAVLPQHMNGWPDRTLETVRERLSCSECGTCDPTIEAVTWCIEFKEPNPWDPDKLEASG